MNDQLVSLLSSLVVLVALRLLDAMLPKGYIFRWTKRWLEKTEEETDEGEKSE